MNFSGKNILITGAGRGLGAAFAIVLADLGATLLLAGRIADSLRALSEQIQTRFGVPPETCVMDLTDLGQISRLAKQWRDEGRKLDILINNGSGWLAGSVEEHDDHEIANLITGNLTGTLLLTRGLLPLLRKSPYADIVNIIAISGMSHVPLQTASIAMVASKAGQAAMTDGLRQELRGQSIRITALYPPYIRDISPLNDGDWNGERSQNSWVDNRDMVDATIAALNRARHVTYQSVMLESDTSNFHFHTRM